LYFIGQFDINQGGGKVSGGQAGSFPSFDSALYPLVFIMQVAVVVVQLPERIVPGMDMSGCHGRYALICCFGEMEGDESAHFVDVFL